MLFARKLCLKYLNCLCFRSHPYVIAYEHCITRLFASYNETVSRYILLKSLKLSHLV